MSITIDISDELLAEIGQEKIEKEIADTVKRLTQQQRRAKGQRLFTDKELAEVLNDLDEIDLTNDPVYQKARQEAWEFYTKLHNLTPDGRRNH